MVSRVSIGEFSTMTRLSRKALRHYHDLGLLEPASVDPTNGYRYYDLDQVSTARLIRRFRDLDLPVPDLKSYVAASDDETRNVILAAHLDRMQTQLRETQETVASLQAMLALPPHPLAIEVHEMPALLAVAITETVALDDVVAWWEKATRELDATARAADHDPAGPLGAQFDHALFADELGDATVWCPLREPVPTTGRVRTTEIPGGWFATAVHDGADARIDETYATLGTYVAERGIGAEGPVRERYLSGALDDSRPLVTEVSWPIRGRAESVHRR
jgi:DNA-binding transcriptional MerR regulator